MGNVEGFMQEQIVETKIFRELVAAIAGNTKDGHDAGPLLMPIARFFLGSPYLAHPLEQAGPERLIVNLHAFDCMTYVETVVALAHTLAKDGTDEAAFTRTLERIRYREGRVDGYASRLHYFSEWLQDNEAKGILHEITAEICGTPWEKRVNFMTAHRDRYPALADEGTYLAMSAVEEAWAARPRHYLPKEFLLGREGQIRDGDILAITADQDGVDVLHCGFALRKRGRIHLLHASERAGRVVVSPETVYRYLHLRRTRTGLLIARV